MNLPSLIVNLISVIFVESFDIFKLQFLKQVTLAIEQRSIYFTIYYLEFPWTFSSDFQLHSS